MRKKTECYQHGGSKTPQYFCIKCKRAHTKHSCIGKAHIGYIKVVPGQRCL